MDRLAVLITVAAITFYGETVTGERSATDILDGLLHNYKRDEVPVADRATQVRLGIYANSFYSINEISMDYSMNLYLRQAWRDPRLAFDEGDFKEMKVGEGRWNEIWLPDTFMRNEKGASFHSVTVPNRLLKINATGHVWYVTKLSMTLSCPMKLQKFPFDTQVCPIMFESFGYTMDSLYYAWLQAPVDVDKGVQLPSFTLKDIILYDCSQNYTAGAFPCLEIRFMLRRDIGYYITQYYLPSMGLIILSWLTFWFPVDATSARLILLLMPVLCMNSMWSTIPSLLPKVSYIKAIDVWMMGCGAFLFAVIMELSLVNIMMKSQSGNQDQPSFSEKDDGLLDKIKMSFSGGSKVSKIDKVCRFAFPLAYLLFVIVYFICYSA